MKTRLRTSRIATTLTVVVALGASSCNDDWGRQDPPSGNQVYPTLQTVATYAFEDEDKAPVLPANFTAAANADGFMPEVVVDDLVGSPVLSMSNGYVHFSNPLNSVTCQRAASFTMWFKQPLEYDEEGNLVSPQDLDTPIIAFVQPYADGNLFGRSRDDEGDPSEGEEPEQTPVEPDENTVYGSLVFTANGMIHYDATDGEFIDNNPADYKTGYMDPDQWHYLAVIIRSDGYGIYVDGMRKVDKYVPKFDCQKMVNFINNAEEVYLNGKPGITAAGNLKIDDLTLYRNEITGKEIAAPKKGNAGGGGGGDQGPVFYNPVYFNDFEGGEGDCTVHGHGRFMTISDPAFGSIFANANEDTRRENYLQLPGNVLSNTANTKELTLAVWINRGNESDSFHYMWSPVFAAYNREPSPFNGSPCLHAQVRGVVSQNANDESNSGDTWCDYTNEQHDNGGVVLYHGDNDWLADGEWHYFVATYTETSAKVYFDGEIVNSWTIDGVSRGGICDFSVLSQLNYVCLGGNQGWDWNDPDPGFYFDDVAIYDHEISQEQIKYNIAAKGTTYYNTFEFDMPGVEIVGDGQFIDSGDAKFGRIFSNAMDGMRQNYLLLPSDVMTKCAQTGAFSMSVWVNRGNETDSGHYNWSPLFMAYGKAPDPDNTWPMMACQYRGVLQFNCNTWCDYRDDQNVNGVNGVYHNNTDADWLADGQWHLYTMTMTATNAKVYFDGELKNEWQLDGAELGGSAAGLFTNGADLNYVCLGGNQAWNWGDPDPGFWFDDIALYNHELTPAEISAIISKKQ